MHNMNILIFKACIHKSPITVNAAPTAMNNRPTALQYCMAFERPLHLHCVWITLQHLSDPFVIQCAFNEFLLADYGCRDGKTKNDIRRLNFL